MTRCAALLLLPLLVGSACEKDKASQPPTAGPPAADDGIDGLGKRCDGGDGAACDELGYLHQFGRGEIQVNAPLAVIAYEKGCNAGNAKSCGALGALHVAGTGTAKDRPKGIAFVEKGCTLKDWGSCFSLATMHGTDANYAISMPPEGMSEEEAAKLFQDSVRATEKYLDAGCGLGHECSCLARKESDCNKAEACSVKMPDGTCVVTCAEEYGCAVGVFGIVGGAAP